MKSYSKEGRIQNFSVGLTGVYQVSAEYATLMELNWLCPRNNQNNK
jgi:hypothetical protein